MTQFWFVQPDAMRSIVCTFIFSSLLTILSGCGEEMSSSGSSPVERSEDALAEVSEIAPEGPDFDEPGTSVENSAGVTQGPALDDVDQGPAESETANVAVAAADSVETDSDPADDELEAQIASFQVPPDWVESVVPRWDVNKPWKEARLEIRRLLGTNVEADRKEGIKLLWEYHKKNDIGDGHEYGFDLYLGGESIWAIKAYRDWLPVERDYLFVRGHTSLASLYVQYEKFDLAEATLNNLMRQIPEHDLPTMRAAETHDSFGDLYVAWGKLDEAKRHYALAADLYPKSKPKYGQHLLPRRAKKVQAKLELLSYGPLAGKRLTDGRYREKTLGYSGDIDLTVTVEGGKVTDIALKHQEKIDQNACVLIPRRIIEAQSLRVDGITGATITKDAIVGGTFGALRKAGLK